MIVETGFEREQALLERWTIRRVQIERGLEEYKLDPGLPIEHQIGLLGHAGLVDRMLSMAPERFRMYGSQAEETARGSLRLLGTLLEEVRNGD